MSLESFKNFVREKPNLITFVRNNEMTWQQFYELYDLYGEENNIWNNFLNPSTNSSSGDSSNSSNIMGTVKDFLGLFKGVDLNSVQKTLTSLDRAIDVFKGFNSERGSSNGINYEERPKYKYFED